MRRIKYTTQFKRDYKREKKSRRHKNLDVNLLTVVNLLATDKLLPPNKCDHALLGNWRNYRNCHVHPDLILIYRKSSNNTLELVRLGSHSELSF